MTIHKRSIYVIASITVLFLLSISAFASYRVVKQFEEKESRLKIERVYPEPDIPKKAVKLYDLLYRGKMEDNVIIQPGEIVYVRSTVISKLGIFLDQLLNPLQKATTIKDIQDIY